MLLSLDTRGVGRVTIIRCSGGTIAGNEIESLRSPVTAMLLIELGSDFSTQEAGEAASQLLANIQSRLRSS